MDAPARLGPLAVLGVLVLGGCGGPSDAPPEGRGNGSETSAVRVVYDGAGTSSEGRWKLHVDLLVEGTDRVRVTEKATGASPMSVIYDGRRLLVHSSEDGPPWTLYEAPTEHADALSAALTWRPDPAAASFGEGCPRAVELGAGTVLGRPAHGYRCAAEHSRDMSSSAYTMWLDDRTGVLLKAPFVSATDITEGVPVGSTTFSTTPPARAEVRVVGPHGTSGGTPREAPPFTLPLTDGGVATSAGYAGRPLVLVFWASDLFFGERDECPRCQHLFRTLHDLTSRPQGPAVLVVVTGDPGKSGYPLLPKGPELPTANDPGEDVKDAYGMTDLAGVALVDSQGHLVRAYDRPPSDEQLRSALAGLP